MGFRGSGTVLEPLPPIECLSAFSCFYENYDLFISCGYVPRCKGLYQILKSDLKRKV